MPEINKLSAIDTLTAGDLVPVFSQSNGDSRKAAMSVLLAYIQDNLSLGSLTTQYAAPSATAFSIDVVAANTHLIITPVGAYANGEVVLPPTPSDKSEVLVNITQAVTTFVVDGNGKSVVGAPTALSAGGFFRMKYDAVLSTWYRVS